MKTAAGYHHQQHKFLSRREVVVVEEEDVIESTGDASVGCGRSACQLGESDKMEVRRSERRPRKKNRIIYCLRSTTIIIFIQCHIYV